MIPSMVRKQIDNFSLEQICLSGQCFRMKREDGEGSRYSLIAGDRYLEIEQQGNVKRFLLSDPVYCADI